MVARVLDGRALASTLLSTLKPKVSSFAQQFARQPTLSVILVGDDAASARYVMRKEEAAESLGVRSRVVRLHASATQEEILSAIHNENENREVDALLVQCPLPAHVDTRKVVQAIDPEKDVDGFHPSNLGKLATLPPATFDNTVDFVHALHQTAQLPCAAQAVFRMLVEAGHKDLRGKNVVVLGRSFLVGMPVMMLLLRAGASVTNLSRFDDIETQKQAVQKAEIVICAIGKACHIGADWIDPAKQCTIIDVGTNVSDERDADGRRVLVGDVNPEAANNAAAMTPVPGGVGPLTVACLLRNCIHIACHRENASFQAL
ncbi:MAG: hypothetical protein MHM6MM_001912 [Cercozoa sp. M6MM]